MFWILIILSIIFIVVGVLLISENKGSSITFFCIAVLSFCFAWVTPQGNMYWLKFKSTTGGNWLIIDNSGGKTMRHWVLEDSYVSSSSQSDGWQFYEKNGNGPIYVSGDAFVMRIKEHLDDFKEVYKDKYNIPEEQEALY